MIEKTKIAHQISDVVINFGKQPSVEKVQSRQEIPGQNALKQEINIDLAKSIEHINKQMQKLQTNIGFRYNEDIEGLIVTVKTADGTKIIREIPNQEAIELLKKVEAIVGVIFDAKG